MRIPTSAAALAALTLCVGPCGLARSADAPAAVENPLDAVPENMPFDVPYGAPSCSGGTGSQDEVACKAGAAAIK